MNENEILGAEVLQGKSRKHTIFIDCTDINPNYSGKFFFHHPSLMEKMKIGVAKSKLLDGLPMGSVEIITDNIAHMSSTLAVVLDNAPDWFVLDQIDEYEVLEKVYDEYTGWLDSFRRKTDREENEGNSGGTRNSVQSVDNGQVERPTN